MKTVPDLFSFSEFEKRLNHLLEIRLDLVPFHISNVGPAAFQVKRWELLSVLSLLKPVREDSILCVADSLGLLSYLLLPFCKVTCNSIKDSWDFEEQPEEKLIASLAHLPPKHPILDKPRFNAVALPSLLDLVPPCRGGLLFAAKKLLVPGGRIMASFTTCEHMEDELHSGKQRVSTSTLDRLLSDFRLQIEASIWLPDDLANGVAGSMRVVRLVRR